LPTRGAMPKQGAKPGPTGPYGDVRGGYLSVNVAHPRGRSGEEFMLKKHRLAAGVALALVLASGAGAQDAATVVATVDGTDITLGEMIIVRSQLPQQYQSLPPDVLFEGILEQLIQQQVLADTMAEEPARVAWALQNERRTLLAGEAIGALTDQAVTEEAVQAAYDAAFAEATPGTEYNAAHILVPTQEEAQAAKDRIDAGADFAEVAREMSTDASGPGGGSLGWFGTGMMVAPFEEAVKALAPGEVSDPVETQFGWHLIKLNETRDQAIPMLDEVRAQIEQQVQQQTIEARLAELTEAATVERPEGTAIDPALLSDLELLQD